MTTKQQFSTTPLRAAEPGVGFDVFTVDGMPVGTVSAIDNEFMRVDAHLRPDFWLRLDDATTIEGHTVTLAYPKEALPHHKHSGPATTPDDFLPAGADPVLLDEAEQLAQREAMERELEEQRRRLARRASAVSTTAEWEREQRAGARVAGIVIVSTAMGVVAAAVLMVGRMRRRQRRAAAEERPSAQPAAAEMPDMRH